MFVPRYPAFVCGKHILFDITPQHFAVVYREEPAQRMAVSVTIIMRQFEGLTKG